MMFIKFAAFQLQQLGLRKQKEREVREARTSQEREIKKGTFLASTSWHQAIFYD